MNLLIDIGNTTTKFGISSEKDLSHLFTLYTSELDKSINLLVGIAILSFSLMNIMVNLLKRLATKDSLKDGGFLERIFLQILKEFKTKHSP